MPPSSRVVLELSLRGVSKAGRSGLSYTQVKRLEREMKYRGQSMGLAVSECRWEKTCFRIVATIPAHLVKANVERALEAALHAIVKKEYPHVVLRGKGGRRGIEDIGLPV